MYVQANILDISDEYDAFFIDVYGVLYNGKSLYEGTLETLEALKRAGKTVIILSNATLTSKELKDGYKKRGFLYGKHYDDMITSGEFTRYMFMSNFNKICEEVGREIKNVLVLFQDHVPIFDDVNVKITKNIDEAELIYMGIPKVSYGYVRSDNLIYKNKKISFEDILDKDWMEISDPYGRKGLSEFVDILEECLKRNLKILVSNPDMFAHDFVPELGDKYPVIKQGALAAYYKRMGGEIIIYGKPYQDIYNYAKTYITKEARAAMIGDTPWTDILGGNNANMDSILVMTGVVEEFFSQLGADISDDRKFEILFKEISPKMINDSNVIPTHVLKRFAASGL